MGRSYHGWRENISASQRILFCSYGIMLSRLTGEVSLLPGKVSLLPGKVSLLPGKVSLLPGKESRCGVDLVK